jgi:hypothetical protein
MNEAADCRRRRGGQDLLNDSKAKKEKALAENKKDRTI